MRKVYLCGGINGLSDDACKNWRAEAAAALAPCFFVLDPMRRDYRGRESENVAAIVHADLFDIKAAHVILANVSAPSWGTAMEIVYARKDVFRKAVIGFNCPDNPSPWLAFHCDHLFPDLASALLHLVKGET